jgi:uracil-DNA glycosylase
MTNLQLQQLKEEYQSCNLCEELCEERTQVVFGSGNPNAKILFIGEAPGLNEAKQGIPFCGASGKILEELLASIGFSRDDVFITNTLICRPPKNRNPKAKEIENCNDRLHKTIQLINPNVIVTVGNFATKAMIPKKAKSGITKIRGHIFEKEIYGKKFKVIPVVHPANLLYNGRNPNILQQMKDDFQVILKATKTL